MTLTLQLEELFLNAYPAYQSLLFDGWLLRLTDGYTRRANSVQPLYGSTLDLAEKIDFCEGVYRAAGLMTVFRLTGVHHPANLDAVLEAHGYALEGDTDVQTASLADLHAPEGDEWATLDTFLTPAWMDDFARLRSLPDDERMLFERMQTQIAPRTGYVRLIVDGAAAAIAMGVLERGWLGVFDVAVDPRLRGRGYGRRVMLHLLGWGKAQGALNAYLQVARENLPARKLYARLGFHTQYHYWYRQKRT